MSARSLVWVGLLAAGCRFAVDGVAVDAAVVVPDDGGGSDGSVEMGAAADLSVLDLATPVLPPDLSGRNVPDGALPRQIGYPCLLGSECDNGLCIDGYCCDVFCDPTDPANKCMACNVPGAEGHCVAALDGTDPRGLCDADPASTCGQDGLCDGAGNCRRYAAGTQCGNASCTNGQVTAPPACDGAGLCHPSTQPPEACAPYVCAADGKSCTTSCTTGGAGCQAGATCDVSGHCNGVKSLGQMCFNGAECQSGNCAQGVCCATACTGVCRSCALPGGAGFCLFAAAGSDPLDQCTASTRDSCGLDGTCNGGGACRDWQGGTTCAPRTCMGDSTVGARVCNGFGTCLPGVPMTCGMYSCDPTSGMCFGSCTNDMQCSGTNRCKKGKCGP